VGVALHRWAAAVDGDFVGIEGLKNFLFPRESILNFEIFRRHIAIVH
jgi:hypothetical protein